MGLLVIVSKSRITLIRICQWKFEILVNVLPIYRYMRSFQNISVEMQL